MKLKKNEMSAQHYEMKLVFQHIMGGEDMAPEAENLQDSANQF